MHRNIGRLIAGAVAVLLTAAPTVAQAPGWSLGPYLAWSDFRGGARDPVGLSAEPSTRLEAGLALHRITTGWRLGLNAGYAPGHLSTRDSSGNLAQLDLLAQSFTRFRLAPLIGRRLMGIGQGGVDLAIGPVLDLWSGDQKVRPRLGAQVRVGLMAPLGNLELENFVGWSAEGSPFDADEFGPGIERPRLQAISFGVEIRLRL